MILLDGKRVSAEVRAEVAARAEIFLRERGRRVTLAVVFVGEDPASQVYVRNKEKACREVGFASLVYRLAQDTEEGEITALIDRLAADERVDGILVQLPLPAGISERAVLAHIPVEKDVDGFTPWNVGRLFLGEEPYLPACTPAGVMRLLAAYGISPDGKHAVVVGRSDLVGKPLALLLLAGNATVTVCHSHTKDLAAHCREADLIVAAVGRAGLITADMVKEGAVVVDVGINRADGKLCGDVAPEVGEKAAYLSPVPGGVGPMTIAMLLQNTLLAAERRQ